MVTAFLEHHLVDRAAILADILTRNAVRREAKLPLLDVRQTYEREVQHKLWVEHARQHSSRVQAQVLAEQRLKFGASYPQSAGGRMAVAQLVHKALRDSFRGQRST